MADHHEEEEIIKKIEQWLEDEDEADNHIFMLLDQWKRSEGEGSRKRSRRFIKRDREEGRARLFNDYFSDNPVYPLDYFRRRFRMSRNLLLRMVQSLENYSPYFKDRVDAIGAQRLSLFQKTTAVIRQLAYGSPADSCDKYIGIGESTAIECLNNFCRCIIDIFGEHYLRKPNSHDVARLLQVHEERHGFPGMLGSIDCMHWEWKKFPVAWKGQFTRGDIGCPTVILEAIASQDLWIWHAYFGIVGSNNDINVLNQSPLFNDVLHGTAPNDQFMVNGTQYSKGYYLADGIYPEWATFVKSFTSPMDPKRCTFKKMQEAARKDVERAFGVLHARWAIVRGLARSWSREALKDIMYACIILHNMIVEDEGSEAPN